jgi:hypothetical protein
LLVIFLSSILQDNLSNVLTEEEMANLMALFERHEVMRGKNVLVSLWFRANDNYQRELAVL